MLHPTRWSRTLPVAAWATALAVSALAPAHAQEVQQDPQDPQAQQAPAPAPVRAVPPPQPTLRRQIFAPLTEQRRETPRRPPETVIDGTEQDPAPETVSDGTRRRQRSDQQDDQQAQQQQQDQQTPQAQEDVQALQEEQLFPLGTTLADVPPRPEEEEEEIEQGVVDPYAPLGFRLGSFLLFPQIEGGVTHTDNIFLTNTDAKADTALYYEPALTFNSTWSRHEISGELDARRSYYDKYTSENDDEFRVLLRGRLDIAERSNLKGELERSLTQENRDDFGFPEGAVTRANIFTDRAAMEGNHTFNRVTVTLRGGVTQEDYGEFQLLNDTATESGASRDNTLNEIGGRTAYELKQGVSAFVDWNNNDRRFRDKYNSNGTRNGSSGYAVQGGLAFDLTDWLTGEASAGYARQTPDDPVNNVIQGFLLNADLTWQVTPLTAVTFNALSDIDATVIDASGSFSRLYAIGVEHALRRNIVLGAEVSYRTETDFDTDDVTRYWTTSLNAEYLLNRWVGIRGEYIHTRSTGELSTDAYTENAVTVGVIVRR